MRGKAQKAARGHRSGTARHKAHRPRSPQGPYGQGKRPHLGLCAVFERQRRADMDQARSRARDYGRRRGAEKAEGVSRYLKDGGEGRGAALPYHGRGQIRKTRLRVSFEGRSAAR